MSGLTPGASEGPREPSGGFLLVKCWFLTQPIIAKVENDLTLPNAPVSQAPFSVLFDALPPLAFFRESEGPTPSSQSLCLSRSSAWQALLSSTPIWLPPGPGAHCVPAEEMGTSILRSDGLQFLEGIKIQEIQINPVCCWWECKLTCYYRKQS